MGKLRGQTENRKGIRVNLCFYKSRKSDPIKGVAKYTEWRDCYVTGRPLRESEFRIEVLNASTRLTAKPGESLPPRVCRDNQLLEALVKVAMRAYWAGRNGLGSVCVWEFAERRPENEPEATEETERKSLDT